MIPERYAGGQEFAGFHPNFLRHQQGRSHAGGPRLLIIMSGRCGGSFNDGAEVASWNR